MVGAGYLIEYFRHRTVTLMLFAKPLAVVFLGVSVLVSGEQAWSVGLSALGDGAMGIAVALGSPSRRAPSEPAAERARCRSRSGSIEGSGPVGMAGAPD